MTNRRLVNPTETVEHLRRQKRPPKYRFQFLRPDHDQEPPMTTEPLTRDDIGRIKVGTMISYTYDVVSGGRQGTFAAKPTARWSEPRRVVGVFAREDDVMGLAFVCFYVEFNEGEGGMWSYSAGEHDTHVRIIADAPAA